MVCFYNTFLNEFLIFITTTKNLADYSTQLECRISIQIFCLLYTPPRTPRISGLKPQVKKLELKKMMKSGLNLFILKFY